MQVHDLNERTAPAAADTAPAGTAPTAAAPVLPVRAFLSGRADELVVDLLAYALYARDREARGPVAGNGASDEEPTLRFRREATADLTNFTYRFFHNQVEEIRLAAVREQLGHLPRPPGFLRLVLASAIAVAGVGAAALWATGHGGLLAEMAARASAAVRGFGV
jgi:hypothetical protein